MLRTKMLTIILLVGLILALLYLATGYLKEKSTNNELIRQIDTSTQTLKLMPAPSIEALKVQMAQVSQEIQMAQDSISGRNVDSTQVLKEILKVADGCNITANPVKTDHWAERNLGSSTYKILPIRMIITGNLPELILFISRLDDREQFPYLVIENLEITNPNVTDQPDMGSNSGQVLTADMTVSIINRSGSSN